MPDRRPAAASAPFPALRTPLTLHARSGSLTLEHRVVMGSMHLNLEGSAEDLIAFYTARARGGAQLMVTGGAAVNRVGAGGPGYTLIGEAEHQDRWARVVEAVHRDGGRMALQLFHAGRYAFEESFGLTPVAPSAVYSRFSRCTPHAMDDDEIAATIEDFAEAAHIAADLGFDAIEVMGSEGYLINQFASPLTNRRDDRWGGDRRRRRAFPVAVLRAVTQAAPALPVIARTSGADLVEGSCDDDEADALAVALAQAGAAAVNVGIGWHEASVPTVQTIVPHAAWRPVIARVHEAVRAAGLHTPVIGSNRVNAFAQAESLVADGVCELVSMARPFLADPVIVRRSFTGHAADVNPCIGCNEACIDRSFGTEPVSCLVNPRAGREREFAVDDLDVPVGDASARPPRRWVAVVGAGPAGMEAARAAAAAGAEVDLYEAGPRIGGQFLMAGVVPGKDDFAGTVVYFERALARAGVRVHTGVRVEQVPTLAGVDHVIVATGVTPRAVTLPGMGGNGRQGWPAVIDYAAAFADLDRVGDRVAVIGAGGIAVDLAHLLAERSPAREVTIMRRHGRIGEGMGVSTRWAVVRAVREAGVRTVTGVGYLAVESEGLRITHEGREQLIAADTIIVAAGQEPCAGLVPALQEAGIEHTVIGGARTATGTNAVAAFEQGLRAGDAAARPHSKAGARV